jgi:hypothetical protein
MMSVFTTTADFADLVDGKGKLGSITAQRPWCAHPRVPVWDGVGDRKDARSYACKPR